MDTKQALWASALAAIGASLCCVAPLVLVTLGLGGAWLSNLTQLEPLRPVFVVLTLGLLALAGRKLYRRLQHAKRARRVRMVGCNVVSVRFSGAWPRCCCSCSLFPRMRRCSIKEPV
jgi:hypothetical protein